mgnify:FL=1
MQKKTYAVLGLGRYGTAVAKELVKNGADVIAVDKNEQIVQDSSVYLPICKCADITDPEVISELGISNADVVIVAMASSLEGSILAITLCKEAGVKTVIAKCANETHRKILKRVGADTVVFPENESGTRLAKNLLTSGFIDVLTLSDDLSLVELNARDEWVGKSLKELNLRKKYTVNVVAFRKNGKITAPVNPEELLDKDTEIIAIVNTAKLSKLK